VGVDLPEPLDEADARHLVWLEFKGQFVEYERLATTSRVAYQASKVAAIVLAAVVTACAGLDVTPWITASLAAAIVVLEGLQQMFQWQANWVNYRRAAETLRQHGLAFAAGMPPYDTPDRRQQLAAVMHGVAISENSSWAGRMTGKTRSPAKED
jgi:hypothetical protein